MCFKKKRDSIIFETGEEKQGKKSYTIDRFYKMRKEFIVAWKKRK